MIKIPIKHSMRCNIVFDFKNVASKDAIAGLGIATLPLHTCQQEIKTGSLKIILPDWAPAPGMAYLIFPNRRAIVPAVRAMIDFLHVELPTAIPA